MPYDFDAPVNRRNTRSVKWDVLPNELPMWIADMDFQTAPAVTEALIRRAQHGVFGYTTVPDEWYAAVQNHWKKNHGFAIQKEWLCFCTGVVPAVTSAVKRVTNAGDNVVLQTPVYDIFFHSVENTGRHVLESRLPYENGAYGVDFDDLEQKLAHPNTTLMILCNPHNPVGHIWSKKELKTIGALCRKHGVTVLSDEIHCDVTDTGFAYQPFAPVSQECLYNSITCISPSKAFNLGGMHTAAVVVPDPVLRNKIVRGLNSDELAEPNCFAVDAAIAAFEHGGEWLTALREYITQNKKAAAAFIREHIPTVHLAEQNATYLLWLDCTRITNNAVRLSEHIRKQTGLFVTAGTQYRGNGNGFLRVNIACPRARMLDGLQRLQEGINTYREA